MKKKICGIAPTQDGAYVMAKLARTKDRWTIDSITRWETESYIRPLQLMHQGVFIGVQSWCMPASSEVTIDDKAAVHYVPEENRPDCTQHYIHGTRAGDSTIHKERFCLNLLGIVPDNLFLSLLPLYFHEDIPDSFISIFGNGEFYLIGVTIQRRLVVAWKFAPGNPELLNAFVGRVERFWQHRFPQHPIPSVYVGLGNPLYTTQPTEKRVVINVLEQEHNVDVLRALGAAFAGIEPKTLLFSGNTPEAGRRYLRTWVYGVSAAIVVSILVMVLGLFGGVFWYTSQKNSFQQEYQRVIANNKEVKKILDQSNTVAEAILRLQETFTRQTMWARFLQALGSYRPKDLFFERLGSEPIKNSTHMVRIAMSGWTARESSVTEFIGKLQQLSYISQITLASLERDKKNTSYYGFTIRCTLLLSEQ